MADIVMLNYLWQAIALEAAWAMRDQRNWGNIKSHWFTTVCMWQGKILGKTGDT